MNTVWTPYEHHANTMWTPCKNRVYSRWTAAAEHYKKVPQIATREEKNSSPSSASLLGEKRFLHPIFYAMRIRWMSLSCRGSRACKVFHARGRLPKIHAQGRLPKIHARELAFPKAWIFSCHGKCFSQGMNFHTCPGRSKIIGNVWKFLPWMLCSKKFWMYFDPKKDFEKKSFTSELREF